MLNSETENLQNALRAAIREIRLHNEEYQHVTPDEMIERWEVLIGDRVVYECDGEPD